MRAGLLESLRLWPTTPAIVRETTQETRWDNAIAPAAAAVLIFVPFFHRDDTRRDYADRFVPDLWLRDDRDEGWPLVPF